MKKLVLGIIIISSFVALSAWLWTLQPTAAPKNVLSEKNSTVQTPQVSSSIQPPDFSVLKTTAVTLKGKANPGQIIAISGGQTNTITKADAQGNFAQSLSLSKGLNLVKVAYVSADFKNIDSQTLTYDVNTDTPALVVFAGSVKTIFDTLITVTAAGAEKSIRAGKSTQIDVPIEKVEGEATPSSAIESIRIGDYAIALGNYPEEKGQTDTVVAQKIAIIRGEKPQNNSLIIAAYTQTDVQKGRLSVKNTKGELIDVVLDENTTVTIAGKTAGTNDVVKDKDAVIVYHQDNGDNLLDTIYIP